MTSSWIGLALIGLLLPSAGFAAGKPGAGADKPVEVELKDAKGTKVGTATLKEAADGVTVSLNATNLAPGKHGIHFHEAGKCDGPDFKSAGAHFAKSGNEHGLDNPKGPHWGDLPNIEVSADGSVKTDVKSNRVTLKGGSENSLLKAGGTALVIHAKADDQKTSPSGDSGDRIACGVIMKK